MQLLPDAGLPDSRLLSGSLTGDHEHCARTIVSTQEIPATVTLEDFTVFLLGLGRAGWHTSSLSSCFLTPHCNIDIVIPFFHLAVGHIGQAARRTCLHTTAGARRVILL